MDDFPCAVNHEEEREDRAEEDVVGLKEVAGPDLMGVWFLTKVLQVWPRLPGGRTGLVYF
jgi:hypothetical protein